MDVMKWVLQVLCMYSFLTVYGQKQIEQVVETHLLQVLEDQEDVYFSDIIQQYNQIRFNWSNIHHPEKWTAFFFLNQKELRGIFTYLEHHPKENSIAFLNRIKGLSKEKAFLIRYIYLQNNQSSTLPSLLKGRISSYWYSPTINQKGLKNRNRIQLSQGKFKWFLQSEKDVKESSILDFISGGFTFSYGRNQWVFGDYLARFGLGLSFYQGYQSSSFFQNLQFFNNTFKLHTGSHENAFLRGIAFKREMSNTNSLMAFVSHKSTDARFAESDVSNLFVDGTHDSRTSLKNKHTVSVSTLGCSYSYNLIGVLGSSLAYINQFSHPILTYYGKYKFQYSLSQTFSYMHPQFTLSTEWSLDQGQYISQMTHLQIHLGQSFYLSTYLLNENKGFKNYMRKLPLSFSLPEWSYGYQLEYIQPKCFMIFSYLQAKTFKSQSFLLKKQFNWSAKLKLKQRSWLQFNNSYKIQYEEKNKVLQHHGLFKHRITYSLQVRGLWNWQQSLSLKWGKDYGVSYTSRLEYKTQNWRIQWGYICFNQSSGGMYGYEPDILGLGYVKGYFKSGNVCYGLVQWNRKGIGILVKIRRYFHSDKPKTGGALGIRYKF